MKNINLGRVLLGGLLAGLVLNVGEFLLNDVVLGTQMREFFARYGIAEPGGSFMFAAVTLTFAIGVVLVFLYALIRPRLGPGVKTAIIAGLIMWFGIYFYTGVVNGLLFGIPINAMMIGLFWGLLEYLLAAIAGAWIYKEA
ncbi:MAG: hypothetical protein M3447_05620 [Acidobacteriota bacterium]|nr:hypothetical protein [Acidobacteriota bacterium]